MTEQEISQQKIDDTIKRIYQSLHVSPDETQRTYERTVSEKNGYVAISEHIDHCVYSLDESWNDSIYTVFLRSDLEFLVKLALKNGDAEKIISVDKDMSTYTRNCYHDEKPVITPSNFKEPCIFRLSILGKSLEFSYGEKSTKDHF